MVRNAGVWAGFPDPCDKRDAVLVEVEEDAAVLARVLDGWMNKEKIYQGPLAVCQVLRLLESAPGDPLREDLIHLCGKRAGQLPSARELGNRFKALQNRVVDGKTLCQTGRKTNLGWTWTVKDSTGVK